LTAPHLRRLLEPDSIRRLTRDTHLDTDGGHDPVLSVRSSPPWTWDLDSPGTKGVPSRRGPKFDIDRTCAPAADLVRAVVARRSAAGLHQGEPDVVVEIDQVRSAMQPPRWRWPNLRLVADAAAAGLRAGPRRALSLETVRPPVATASPSPLPRRGAVPQIAAAHRRFGSALRQLGVPHGPPANYDLRRQAARWEVRRTVSTRAEVARRNVTNGKAHRLDS